MILGILPLYVVNNLGASRPMLGVMDGSAELISYAFRMVSGSLSDHFRKRKIFVLILWKCPVSLDICLLYLLHRNDFVAIYIVKPFCRIMYCNTLTQVHKKSKNQKYCDHCWKVVWCEYIFIKTIHTSRFRPSRSYSLI